MKTIMFHYYAPFLVMAWHSLSKRGSAHLTCLNGTWIWTQRCRMLWFESRYNNYSIKKYTASYASSPVFNNTNAQKKEEELPSRQIPLPNQNMLKRKGLLFMHNYTTRKQRLSTYSFHSTLFSPSLYSHIEIVSTPNFLHSGYLDIENHIRKTSSSHHDCFENPSCLCLLWLIA